jgi:hypothetical protein
MARASDGLNCTSTSRVPGHPEQLARWITIATPVVKRSLQPFMTAADIGRADRLSQVVREYSAQTLRRQIVRSVDEEVASMWPGLTVDIQLRDDSTVADVVDEIARRAAEWFGD